MEESNIDSASVFHRSSHHVSPRRAEIFFVVCLLSRNPPLRQTEEDAWRREKEPILMFLTGATFMIEIDQTKIQRHIIVNGRVQGVNFRYFTQLTAQRLGIQGYVRNLCDGGVEIVAEGEEATLDRFVTVLWKGPPAAKVEAVKVEARPFCGEYASFSIAY